jgi:hypothetical protein
LWGAILLGFFAKSLVDEVTLKGWKTPRAVWASSLCLSSTVFVIHYLDPRTILGLYPANILKLIESIEIITLASAFGFSGYMYLIALYQRNMNSVPKYLRNVWLLIMITFSVLHAVFSILGASTGNLYWFGVDGFILATHEMVMTAVLNYSIFKLGLYLHELNKEKSSLGAQSTNFHNALRKMTYVRVCSIMMTVFAVSYQILSPGSARDRVAKPFTPIFYDTSTFSGLTVIPALLACGLHSLLLYMLRRPQPKSGGSSEKTKESTPQLQSRSSKTRPSTASSYVDLNPLHIEAPEDLAKIPVPTEAEDVAKIAVSNGAPDVEIAVRTAEGVELAVCPGTVEVSEMA